MASVAIDIDGHVDLLARDPTRQGGPGKQDDQIRISRLNDVMIALEGARDVIERDLKHRLLRTVLTPGVSEVRLTLHATAPEFHVAVVGTDDGSLQRLPTTAEREAIETAVAAELFLAIQKRVANWGPRRWQPSVTATLRVAKTDHKPSKSPPRPTWVQTLFWLFIIVVLATAYLYLKRFAM